MSTENDKLIDMLVAKEAIRELVLLYSRGVDRKDGDLLRTLYTADATDTHGDSFDGGQQAYVDFLEQSFPYMQYSGHHVCNHLISVEGDQGEGEVYALAYHYIPDGQGGFLEDFMCVRYVDQYRKEADGRWRFSKRVVTYDYHTRRPIPADTVDGQPTLEDDPTFTVLQHRLFSRGKRA